MVFFALKKLHFFDTLKWSNVCWGGRGQVLSICAQTRWSWAINGVFLLHHSRWFPLWMRMEIEDRELEGGQPFLKLNWISQVAYKRCEIDMNWIFPKRGTTTRRRETSSFPNKASNFGSYEKLRLPSIWKSFALMQMECLEFVNKRMVCTSPNDVMHA